MTTYYVRKTGSDGAAGTSAGTAYATIGKLIGASGVAVSGDLIYVGAGVYREANVTCAGTWTSEVRIVGDVTGAFTGDPGDVVWTCAATDDKTAPAATTSCLDLNGKNFLTLENLYMVGGTRSGASVIRATSATHDITLRKCVLVNGLAGDTAINPTGAANVAMNWTVDSCIFFSGGAFALGAPTSASADYDLNFQIKNCLFLGASQTLIPFTPTGALSFKPGGIDMFNCSAIAKTVVLNTAANSSTTYPCTVYNCFLHSTTSSTLTANAAGQIVEDYNVFWSASPRTNVTAGTNSKDGNPLYSPLMELGQSFIQGRKPRPPFSPMLTSPLLGFGNQAGGPSVDIFNVPKPSGPGRTWANALNSVGCYELGDTASKETTTVRSGSNAIKLLGPAIQDFDVPVNAVSTTITVYGRYDSTYAGTKPAMSVLNCEEAGVTTATSTMVGAADTWEQLSLTFTPTAAGIVTIRLRSSSTAGGGAAFFDDFNVA